MAFQAVVKAAGRYIDIEKSIAVDIGHGNARAPVGGTGHTGFGRNVFENKISLVEVEFVIPLAVGGKIDIGQAIVVDVAGGHSAAIVVIQVVQDIEHIPVIVEFIFEINLRGRRGKTFEHGFLLSLAGTKDGGSECRGKQGGC